MNNFRGFTGAKFQRFIIYIICMHYALKIPMSKAAEKEGPKLGQSCDSGGNCAPWLFGDRSFSVTCISGQCQCEPMTTVVDLGGVKRCFSVAGAPCRIFDPVPTLNYSASELNYLNAFREVDARLCVSGKCIIEPVNNQSICGEGAWNDSYTTEITTPKPNRTSSKSIGCPSSLLSNFWSNPFTGFELVFLVSSALI